MKKQNAPMSSRSRIVAAGLGAAAVFAAVTYWQVRGRDATPEPAGAPAAASVRAPAAPAPRLAATEEERAKLLSEAAAAGRVPPPLPAGELPPGYVPAAQVQIPPPPALPPEPPPAPPSNERPSMKNPGGVDGARPPRP